MTHDADAAMPGQAVEQLLAETAWLDRLAHGLLRYEHEAEDVAQEARLAALRMLGTLHQLSDGARLGAAVLEPLLQGRQDVQQEHLATLAAYLRPDDEARIVDEHVELLDADDEPDLVVIQVYITNAYRAYRIADRPGSVDPLTRRHVLAWPRPLDLDAVNEASAALVGQHDFASFCRRRDGATTIRTLLDLSWQRDGDGVAVATVRADAFCHSMVRALVGCLLAIGEGRRRSVRAGPPGGTTTTTALPAPSRREATHISYRPVACWSERCAASESRSNDWAGNAVCKASPQIHSTSAPAKSAACCARRTATSETSIAVTVQPR